MHDVAGRCNRPGPDSSARRGWIRPLIGKWIETRRNLNANLATILILNDTVPVDARGAATDFPGPWTAIGCLRSPGLCSNGTVNSRPFNHASIVCAGLFRTSFERCSLRTCKRVINICPYTGFACRHSYVAQPISCSNHAALDTFGLGAFLQRHGFCLFLRWLAKGNTPSTVVIYGECQPFGKGWRYGEQSDGKQDDSNPAVSCTKTGRYSYCIFFRIQKRN